jgi:TRAP-type uncharacterized transport system substrate-binding protein
LIAFVGLGLYVAYRVLDPTPEKRIVIATGPEEGAYIEFAKRYQPLLHAHGLVVELRTTQGSSENLALLRDPQSGVDAAFVQGGVDTVDRVDTRRWHRSEASRTNLSGSSVAKPMRVSAGTRPR